MQNATSTETSPTTFIRYSDSVEVKKPDEDKVFDDIAAAMHRLNLLMYDRYRHAIRSVHAKSHGLLRGQVTVHDNLPEPLRQGLFAAPATYPAILRLSTNPGDLLADSISTPRGMAIKVIGVTGEVLPTHAPNVTQDFVLADGKAFGSPDAAGFLGAQRLIEKNANDPEFLKKIVSFTARGVNAALGVVGQHSPSLEQLGRPETHILGETFYSAVPLRYGDYIAKIRVAPASPNLKELVNKHLNAKFHYSALRDAVVEFFKTQSAEWEIGVQLCADLASMPIEDASKEWPEDISPYRPVAHLTVGPQDAYSPRRRVYVDDILSFNPWHALAAHRPLGNIMRARFKAYQVSSSFRHEMNDRAAVEPRSIDDLPD
ncbi:MAG TPA: catalase family protein [Tepidisphaeraceae bacterium]|jgi:hypothetical protein|nr:catalase family protein [Tepidisphaeraceae bacterium]